MNQPEPAALTAASGPTQAPATSVATDLKVVLRDGRFRLLLLANFISTIGDWLTFMALFSLTSFTWNKGVSGISILGIAYMLPVATLSPVAGVWVDRWGLRRVMVTTSAARAVIVLAMAAWPHFWSTCVLLCAHQVVASFFNPAQHSALARLVRREHLLVANALNTQAAQLTKILGPGVAGLLVAWLGPRGCFQFDAALLLVAALFLTQLPRLPGMTAERTNFASEFRVGFTFLRGTTRLRTVILLLMLGLCALGGFIAVLPVFARDQLGAGPRVMGFLLSSMGAGAAIGAFAVAHAGKKWDKTWCITSGAWIAAFSLWLVAQTSRVEVAIAATSILGVGVVFLLVPAYALLQEETPQDLLGRVVSLAIAALSMAQMLGMGVIGGAARRWRPVHLLQAEAVLLGAAALVFLIWSYARRNGRAGRARETFGLPST
ncbi:MAG TPA: MFS transporter [Candidatus Krumholzibacteria bacterium]|nr:MFS transporter [Candidatus Krumholzibacteria bacterium]